MTTFIDIGVQTWVFYLILAPLLLQNKNFRKKVVIFPKVVIFHDKNCDEMSIGFGLYIYMTLRLQKRKRIFFDMGGGMFFCGRLIFFGFFVGAVYVWAIVVCTIVVGTTFVVFSVCMVSVGTLIVCTNSSERTLLKLCQSTCIIQKSISSRLRDFTPSQVLYYLKVFLS